MINNNNKKEIQFHLNFEREQRKRRKIKQLKIRDLIEFSSMQYNVML